MAQTRTETRTETRTRQRIRLIWRQIAFLIEQTLPRDADLLQRLHLGITRNHWIRIFTVESVDNSGLVHGSISLTIDWEKHRMRLDSHGEFVTVQVGRWLDDVNADFRSLVDHFNAEVKHRRHRSRFWIRYTEAVYEEDGAS